MIETQRNEAPEITEEEPINILDEISFWLEEKAIFMLYLPEYINETQIRRMAFHNVIVVILSFAAFILSLLVLSQDIEDSTKYNSVQIY
ncbi:hypothetical protein GCK72_006740 [Caenorhabditis remanei]|uniref:Uncharacterized protein n=1 Tax=Caenorhabditis remanei TaxID=31234 RepID=A0A6A5HLN4_CAERE|nr:hypothetical protein GCK72_006740 [Caenorhabditis remanei]KAF1766782.1 hypothetical protein GCK72_006740 [Caenorhabditis remanei]